MTKPVTNQIKFRQHPQMIISQIKSQADSLTKAILEAIMNCIDAGSPDVHITMTHTTITIADTGSGFDGLETIEKFFSTIGTPHEDGDAKFGRFRMGRCQMFGYGRNTWRSGPFRMEVDIANRGLEHDIFDNEEPVKGCQITIELYNPLSDGTLISTAQQIRYAITYVDTPIYINNEQVNTDLSSVRWTRQTDEAYFLYRKSGSLTIYNQGVFVTRRWSNTTYFSGLIVTKKAIALNAARNEVIETDPLWEKISETATAIYNTRNKNKKDAILHQITNDATRLSYIRDLLAGKQSWYETYMTGEPVFQCGIGQESTLKDLVCATIDTVAIIATHSQSAATRKMTSVATISEPNLNLWKARSPQDLKKIMLKSINNELNEMGTGPKQAKTLKTLADAITSLNFQTFSELIENPPSNKKPLARQDMTASERNASEDIEQINTDIAAEMDVNPRPIMFCKNIESLITSDHTGFTISIGGASHFGLQEYIRIMHTMITGYFDPKLNTETTEPDQDIQDKVENFIVGTGLIGDLITSLNNRRTNESISKGSIPGRKTYANISDFENALRIAIAEA